MRWSWARGAWRTAATGAVALWGAWVIEPGAQQVSPASMQAWCRAVLRALGIRLVIEGRPHAGPAVPMLLVANHVSWADALCIGAAHPCSFLVKSEARDWPVVGRLVRRHGGAFVVSGVVGAEAMRGTISAKLVAGANVCVFPEGGTSDGRRLLPFHHAAFDAAITAGAPVRVMALHYSLRGDGARGLVVAGWSSGSLLSAFWRVACARGLEARLIELGRIEGDDRASAAAQARAMIAGALGLEQQAVGAGVAARPRAADAQLDAGAAALLAFVRQQVADQKDLPLAQVDEDGTMETLDLDSLDLLPILFTVSSRLRVSPTRLQELVTHETTLRDFARGAHALAASPVAA